MRVTTIFDVLPGRPVTVSQTVEITGRVCLKLTDVDRQTLEAMIIRLREASQAMEKIGDSPISMLASISRDYETQS